MKRIKSIIIITTLSLITIASSNSCRRLPDFSDDKIVAKVGDRELRQSELNGVVPAGIVGEDSIQAVETYIEGWARRYIKLMEAEKVSEGNAEIERQIREYREALLIRNLDLYYANQTKDTTVTDEQILEYYNEHKTEFKLDRLIIKGLVVRVPISYRQQSNLKSLMSSPLPSRRQDFRDICTKNGFQMSEFTDWTDWTDFVTMLPEGEKGSSAMIAVSGKYSDMADREYRYMLFVDGVLKSGDTAPLERVSENIARIIRNGRINDAIRINEDSLYNAGVASGEIEILVND